MRERTHVPHELEAELISDSSETIVAFALLK